MRGPGAGWRRATLLAGLACGLGASACAPPEPPEEEGRLHVVATIGMIRA